jgi:hypothetical protein
MLLTETFSSRKELYEFMKTRTNVKSGDGIIIVWGS